MTIISVLIPCLDEEAFIGRCLDSVLAFQLPAGVDIEVLVLDGGSADRTRDIVAQYTARDSRIRLLDNPGRIQATALNIGIRQSRGDYIMRLDAHSAYGRDYLRLCWETAARTAADNVGGLFVTQARGDGYEAALVQALTTHPFGVGNAGFRINAGEGPADTVPYGFFRREIFQRIGWFDERLERAQDYEFNRRILAAGGRIWRNPAIRVFYYQQPTLAAFYRKQLLREAPYNAYLWYLAPYAFAPRHAITAAFALGVIGGVLVTPISTMLGTIFGGVMALYAVLALLSAAQQGVRYRRPLHVLALPPCFFLYHFLHGVGVLAGLAKLFLGIAPVQRAREPWPGAGRRRAWSGERALGLAKLP
jgi:glycosyltransferase involved in cell wall biosynthesis